jgi:hypothetical protein
VDDFACTEQCDGQTLSDEGDSRWLCGFRMVSCEMVVLEDVVACGDWLYVRVM